MPTPRRRTMLERHLEERQRVLGQLIPPHDPEEPIAGFDAPFDDHTKDTILTEAMKLETDLRTSVARAKVSKDHWKARAVAVEKRLAAMVPMLCQQQDEILRWKKKAEYRAHQAEVEQVAAAQVEEMKQQARAQQEQHRASIARLAALRQTALQEKEETLQRLSQQAEEISVGQLMMQDQAEGKHELLQEMQEMQERMKRLEEEHRAGEGGVQQELTHHRELARHLEMELQSAQVRCDELGQSLWDQIHANEALEAKLQQQREERYAETQNSHASEAVRTKALADIRLLEERLQAAERANEECVCAKQRAEHMYELKAVESELMAKGFQEQLEQLELQLQAKTSEASTASEQFEKNRASWNPRKAFKLAGSLVAKQHENTKHAHRNEALHVQVLRLTQDFAGLQTEQARALEHSAELREANASLTEQLAELAQTNEGLQRQMESTKQQHDDLVEDVRRRGQQDSEQQEAQKALAGQFAALQEELAAEVARGDALQATLDGLRDMRERHAQTVIAKMVRARFMRKRLQQLSILVRSTKGEPNLDSLRTRNSVCKEILITEEKYIRSLDILYTFLQAIPPTLFEMEFVDGPARLAFSKAKEGLVHMRHRHLDLYETFKQAIIFETGEKGRLSVVFEEVAQVLLQHYGDYVCRLPLLQPTFRQWFSADKEFEATMNRVAKEVQAELGIWSYMNLPIQRMVGYMQFLTRYKKLTPSNSIDYEHLARVDVKLEDAGRVVDRSSKLYKGLIKMQRSVLDLPQEFSSTVADDNGLGVQCYDELVHDEQSFFCFLISDRCESLSIVLCSRNPGFETANEKIGILKQYTVRPFVFVRVVRLTGGALIESDDMKRFELELPSGASMKFSGTNVKPWREACKQHDVRVGPAYSSLSPSEQQAVDREKDLAQARRIKAQLTGNTDALHTHACTPHH